MEGEQSSRGLRQRIEEGEKSVRRIERFAKSLSARQNATLQQPQEQNSTKAAGKRPVSAPVAPGLCNKRSSTTSSRSCRARNPLEQNVAMEPAAACGGDAPARCKNLPRNSPRHRPATQLQPTERAIAQLPAGKTMLQTSEVVLVSGYSQELDTALNDTPDRRFQESIGSQIHGTALTARSLRPLR